MNATTNDRIRQRAYELWEADGKPDGRHQNHWLTAEAEVRASEKPTGKGAKATTVAPAKAPSKNKTAPRKTPRT